MDSIKAKKEQKRPASAEQQAFVDGVLAAEPGDAIVLDAKAGTGKTFALVRCAQALTGRVLMLVFNAKNRKELQARAPKTCEIHTFHSFSGEVLRRRGFDTDANVGKIWGYLRDDRNGVTQRARYPVAQGVSLAKNLGLGLGEGWTPERLDAAWAALYSEYDIRIPKRVGTGYVIEHAKRAFAATLLDHSEIDFDDMLYFAASEPLPDGFAYDYVMIDELQDASGAQNALVDRLRAAGNVVLIGAGDPAQAIYGFRGAGVGAFYEFVSRYDAAIYPLTATRRCPRAVVAEAARIVPAIRAHEDAEEGFVLCATHAEFIPAEVEPGAAVLCRNNAPLLEAALRCLDADVPCVLLGRDMANAITYQTTSAFRGNNWRLDDAAAFEGLVLKVRDELKDKPFALSTAIEEIDCAKALHAYLGRTGMVPNNLDAMTIEIENICKRLFSDDAKEGAILFSTIHRAKGLEWDTVYCLKPEKIPSKSAVKAGSWHLEQELNLLYVMITRAKTNLVYITNLEDPVGSILNTVAAARLMHDA